jgi:hypothetical protein
MPEVVRGTKRPGFHGGLYLQSFLVRGWYAACRNFRQVSFCTTGTTYDLTPEGGTTMDHRSLLDTERRQLLNALRANAEDGRAILMDRRDTGFAGTADDVTDEEVIAAIQSIPCHY